MATEWDCTTFNARLLGERIHPRVRHEITRAYSTRDGGGVVYEYCALGNNDMSLVESSWRLERLYVILPSSP